MHYMLLGLYFEEQCEEPRTRHMSLTDPLDQWFLFGRGIREKPAPKPEMRIPSASAQFLDTLCEAGRFVPPRFADEIVGSGPLEAASWSILIRPSATISQPRSGPRPQ
jgi:hypothetical protein